VACGKDAVIRREYLIDAYMYCYETSSEIANPKPTSGNLRAQDTL